MHSSSVPQLEVSDQQYAAPRLPTTESSYPVNGWPSGVSRQTLHTYIKNRRLIKYYSVLLYCQINDAKNVGYYGSSALNCINSARMSDSFKLYLTLMPGFSGLPFSLLAECIIILLHHSWFVRSPLIKCKFFTAIFVVFLSFSEKETYL